MRLVVKGRSSRGVKKQLIQEAARWYCRKLLTPNLYRKLKLNIHIKRLDKNLFGEIHYKDPRRCNYSYDIDLNKEIGEKALLCTLAHELVHTKQYASGEYVSHKRKSRNHMVRWKGELIDSNSTDYWDHPWEIEAAGMETGLYYRFINDMVDKGKV